MEVGDQFYGIFVGIGEPYGKSAAEAGSSRCGNKSCGKAGVTQNAESGSGVVL